jgi:RNA polymerase sigma factor (sigma-70 family)
MPPSASPVVIDLAVIDPTAHLKLVFCCAHRLGPRCPAGLEAGDLVAPGWRALVRAAKTYDPARGALGAYLSFNVRRGMRQAMTRHKVWRQAPAPYEDGDACAEVPDRPAADPHAREEAARLLEVLPPRLRELVEHRFGLGGGEELSAAELAGRMGVSVARINQLLGEAMRLLRESAARCGMCG